METKNVIREMSMCEMMDANGGGFFFSSASTWFWRGLGIGATAGGLGASISLSA